jgi:c-di-GMP-binding flagellar brake protein YcgR
MSSDDRRLKAHDKVDSATAWRALRSADHRGAPIELGVLEQSEQLSWWPTRFVEPPSPVVGELRLKRPRGDGGAPELAEDDDVLGFFQFDGATYMFPAKVRVTTSQLIDDQEVEVVVLGAPASFYHFQRRKHLRVRPTGRLDSTVAIVDEELSAEEQRLFPAEVEDLSLGGTKVRILRNREAAFTAFREGRKLAITLPLIDVGDAVPFYLLGEAVRVTGGEEAGSPVRVGVKWDPMPEGDRDLLDKYVRRAEQERLRRRAQFGSSR